MANEEQTPADPPADNEPPPLLSVTEEERSPKILLVEDHVDTLLTMARLLRKFGYPVVTAVSVQTALDLAAGEPFDLLISDLELPDGSGLEIMRYVKERSGMRGIALSGYGTDEDIRQSREAGFSGSSGKYLLRAG